MTTTFPRSPRIRDGSRGNVNIKERLFHTSNNYNNNDNNNNNNNNSNNNNNRNWSKNYNNNNNGKHNSNIIINNNNNRTNRGYYQHMPLKYPLKRKWNFTSIDINTNKNGTIEGTLEKSNDNNNDNDKNNNTINNNNNAKSTSNSNSTTNLNKRNNNNNGLDHLEENEFSVMSYNILAQNLIQENFNLYSKINRQNLTWEYRFKKILGDIHRYQPSIICLQEVDMYNDFENKLCKGARANYDGMHVCMYVYVYAVCMYVCMYV